MSDLLAAKFDCEGCINHLRGVVRALDARVATMETAVRQIGEFIGGVNRNVTDCRRHLGLPANASRADPLPEPCEQPDCDETHEALPRVAKWDDLRPGMTVSLDVGDDDGEPVATVLMERATRDGVDFWRTSSADTIYRDHCEHGNVSIVGYPTTCPGVEVAPGVTSGCIGLPDCPTCKGGDAEPLPRVVRSFDELQAGDRVRWARKSGETLEVTLLERSPGWAAHGGAWRETNEEWLIHRDDVEQGRVTLLSRAEPEEEPCGCEESRGLRRMLDEATAANKLLIDQKFSDSRRLDEKHAACKTAEREAADLRRQLENTRAELATTTVQYEDERRRAEKNYRIAEANAEALVEHWRAKALASEDAAKALRHSLHVAQTDARASRERYEAARNERADMRLQLDAANEGLDAERRRANEAHTAMVDLRAKLDAATKAREAAEARAIAAEQAFADRHDEIRKAEARVKELEAADERLREVEEALMAEREEHARLRLASEDAVRSIREVEGQRDAAVKAAVRCAEMMRIQEKRETEDFHLSVEAFRPMWDEAKAMADALASIRKPGGTT